MINLSPPKSNLLAFPAHLLSSLLKKRDRIAAIVVCLSSDNWTHLLRGPLPSRINKRSATEPPNGFYRPLLVPQFPAVSMLARGRYCRSLYLFWTLLRRYSEAGGSFGCWQVPLFWCWKPRPGTAQCPAGCRAHPNPTTLHNSLGRTAGCNDNISSR